MSIHGQSLRKLSVDAHTQAGRHRPHAHAGRQTITLKVFGNLMHRNFTHLLALLILCPFADHANAGLFGPSTYEDCIIDGAKSAKSDEAMTSITAACYAKFKEKTDRAVERENRERQEKLLKKCTLDVEANTRGKVLFSGGGKAIKAMNSLKGHQFSLPPPSISFQNNGPMPVAAVMLGFGPPNKQCTSDLKAYKATLLCSNEYQQVQVSRFGTLPCQDEAKKFAGQDYCIVAIGYSNTGSGKSLVEMLNDGGFCD